MGLDMYLTGKRYMSTTFNKEDGPRKDAIARVFPELEGWTGRWGDSNPIREVSIDVGYWRKANAIHKWFVDNCQEGEDDCGHYYVGREQLSELRDLCRRVLDFRHLANDQLPTVGGFFFGGTDYDEHYYRDLASTIEIIDRALTLPDDWDFEYHSIW